MHIRLMKGRQIPSSMYLLDTRKGFIWHYGSAVSSLDFCSFQGKGGGRRRYSAVYTIQREI
jgi:hypothetical protein